MELDFEGLPGVEDVVSGFTGGTARSPTYNDDHTGHYEAVEITYDPSIASYQDLLDHYWVNIDPFDATGQFCCKGPSYRAAIFVSTPEESRLAEQSKQDVQAMFPDQRVVTKILDACGALSRLSRDVLVLADSHRTAASAVMHMSVAAQQDVMKAPVRLYLLRRASRLPRGHRFLRTVFFFAVVFRVALPRTFLRAFLATFVLRAFFALLLALERALLAASLARSTTTSNPSRTRSIMSLAMSSAPTS